ncbi:Putative deacetylase LmbE-like domain protein [Acididesulfobacillus acetoxydans]|uniref:Deacetylase LmbE-like domain protein n=1 Tax=Acididesulfobacillus acetoxydans TaxID=1561005 RepID=A0A8S0X2Y1_9FIRM|nr:PIG-L family deacetylase [Acididesulfobacillus acetoxydans]CAA7599590.1 Putative deacetylase LmbE-like domain protein [Acididesulfobacillus acetoxydans]CEJ07785.1 GlcNAc-PI de-N-acetylase [Acididesulfobacillus acetoxydans]
MSLDVGKSLKLLRRKVYFALFNARGFDLGNTVYFRRLFRLNRKEIEARCRVVEHLPGRRIAILAPHCDDEIIGCGGAILSYLQDQKEVFIIYLTDGQKQGSTADAATVRKERREEGLAVGASLGLPQGHIYFLGGTDGDLLHSHLDAALAQTLREIRPDTLFVPVILDNHPDHYAVSKLLCRVYAGEPAFLRESSVFLYEAQSPLTLFHANICLKINRFYARKTELLSHYKSQPYSFKFIANLNRANGLYLGPDQFCESFLATNMEAYEAFVRRHFADDAVYFRLKDHFKSNRHSGSLICSYNSSRRYKDLLAELPPAPVDGERSERPGVRN